MKKIEEKYMVEKVNVMFEAADGTRFFDEEECKNYEKTAKCAIKAAFMDVVTAHSGSYNFFPGGNDDQETYIVIPKTDDDLKAIRMYESWICSKYGDPGETHVLKDYKGKALFFVVGYDEEWCEVRLVDDVLKKISDSLLKSE